MRTKNKRESIQFETDIRQGRVERTEIIIPAQLGSLLHSLIALAVGGICWIWQYRICKIINIISLFYGHWDYLLWSAGKCIYMFSNLPTAATALHPLPASVWPKTLAYLLGAPFWRVSVSPFSAPFACSWQMLPLLSFVVALLPSFLARCSSYCRRSDVLIKCNS